eukprot:TRINITY_DN4711_c0_g1_i2.p1 TRINITY_DN4711_c0_g1~~TRINITY_DN4711_c0_g1_i2.p1  ORF type:complete len:733 (+),score=138.24 TRINITY_DN4711_c0_g1_i2:83-2281(+)
MNSKTIDRRRLWDKLSPFVDLLPTSGNHITPLPTVDGLVPLDTTLYGIRDLGTPGILNLFEETHEKERPKMPMPVSAVTPLHANMSIPPSAKEKLVTVGHKEWQRSRGILAIEDIIQEMIAEDTNAEKNRPQELYQGNAMAIGVVFGRTVMMFPTGQIMSDLALMEIKKELRSEVLEGMKSRFAPAGISDVVFLKHGCIYQVLLYIPDEILEDQEPFVLVRHGNTLTNLRFNTKKAENPDVPLQFDARRTRIFEFESRAIHHIALNPFPMLGEFPFALICSDGSIYIFSNDTNAFLCTQMNREEPIQDSEPGYQFDWGPHPMSFYVGIQNKILLVDFTLDITGNITRLKETTLADFERKDEHVLALKRHPTYAFHFFVVTEDRVILFDERTMTRTQRGDVCDRPLPLLQWKLDSSVVVYLDVETDMERNTVRVCNMMGTYRIFQYSFGRRDGNLLQFGDTTLPTHIGFLGEYDHIAGAFPFSITSLKKLMVVGSCFVKSKYCKRLIGSWTEDPPKELLCAFQVSHLGDVFFQVAAMTDSTQANSRKDLESDAELSECFRDAIFTRESTKTTSKRKEKTIDISSAVSPEESDEENESFGQSQSQMLATDNEILELLREQTSPITLFELAKRLKKERGILLDYDSLLTMIEELTKKDFSVEVIKCKNYKDTEDPRLVSFVVRDDSLLMAASLGIDPERVQPQENDSQCGESHEADEEATEQFLLLSQSMIGHHG